MGQKINPTGLRIGVIKNWESRWYAAPEKFGDTLVEDYNLREYLLEKLAPAGVPKVEIERDAKRVRINIHVASPVWLSADRAQKSKSLRKSARRSLAAKRFRSTSSKSSSPTLMLSLLLKALLHSSKEEFPSVVLSSRQSAEL